MTDYADLITGEVAARLLEERPPIRLKLTLAECELLIEHLSFGAYAQVAVLIEKIRARGLLQAEEICRQAALLHSAPASDSAN